MLSEGTPWHQTHSTTRYTWLWMTAPPASGVDRRRRDPGRWTAKLNKHLLHKDALMKLAEAALFKKMDKSRFIGWDPRGDFVIS